MDKGLQVAEQWALRTTVSIILAGQVALLHGVVWMPWMNSPSTMRNQNHTRDPGKPNFTATESMEETFLYVRET